MRGPTREARQREDVFGDEEAGKFSRGGNAVADGDGGMFVADHVTAARLRGGFVAVEEDIFASDVFAAQNVFGAEFF